MHSGIEMRAGGGEREVRQRLDEIFFLDLLMHSGCVSALETFILSIIHRVRLASAACSPYHAAVSQESGELPSV